MSDRPNPIPPPKEADVVLALAGDRRARLRVKVQKSRLKKRLREMDQYDSAQLAAR